MPNVIVRTSNKMRSFGSILHSALATSVLSMAMISVGMAATCEQVDRVPAGSVEIGSGGALLNRLFSAGPDLYAAVTNLGVPPLEVAFKQRTQGNPTGWNEVCSAGAHIGISQTVVYKVSVLHDERTGEALRWSVTARPTVGNAGLLTRVYSSPPPSWRFEVRNIDDRARIVVNGREVRDCGYMQACSEILDNHLRKGRNTVVLKFENTVPNTGWTYGYDRYVNSRFVPGEKCGVAGTTFCNASQQLGIVFTRSFPIDRW